MQCFFFYDPNRDFSFVPIDAKTPPDEPLIVIVEDYSLTDEEAMELESKGTIVIRPDIRQPTELPPMEAIPINETIPGYTPPTAAPNQPKNLTARAMQDGISLSWHEPDGTTASNRVVLYEVYRKKGAEEFALLTKTSANHTVFLDTGTEVGQTTYYYVIAWNGIGYSPISNICEITGIGYPPRVATFEANAVSSNSVHLKWELIGDNDYVEAFVLKREKKKNAMFEDYKTFSKETREYIDNTGINVFDTVFYQLYVKVNNNLSAGVQDFVFMPERNPATPAPVRLHALRFNGNLKGFWEWSYPSFCIKVVNVDRKDNNKTKIVVNQIYFDAPVVGWGVGNATDLVFYICNRHLFNWTVDDWYDSITFYIQKTKRDKDNPFDIIGSLNLKGELGTIIQTVGNVLNTGFSRKEDIEIGLGYTNYFDPLWSVIEFQNYGVKLVIGDNSENGVRDCPAEAIGTFFTGAFLDNQVLFFDGAGAFFEI